MLAKYRIPHAKAIPVLWNKLCRMWWWAGRLDVDHCGYGLAIVIANIQGCKLGTRYNVTPFSPVISASL